MFVQNNLAVEAPPAPDCPPFKCSSSTASSSESDFERLKITTPNDTDNFPDQFESDESVYGLRRTPTPEVLSSSEMSDGSTVLLVRVLRHLSNLDRELIPFIPKFNEMLEKAVPMESLAKGSSVYLLMDPSNLKLLKTSKDVLELTQETVDPSRVRAVEAAIEYIADLLLETEPLRYAQNVSTLKLPQNNQGATSSGFVSFPTRNFESSSEAEVEIYQERPRKKKIRNALKTGPSTEDDCRSVSNDLATMQPHNELQVQLKTATETASQPSQNSLVKSNDVQPIIATICSVYNEAQKLKNSFDEKEEKLGAISEVFEEISTENMKTADDSINITLELPKTLADITLKIKANESGASMSTITPAGAKTVKIDEIVELANSLSKIVIPVATIVPQVIQSIESASKDLPKNIESMVGKILNLFN